MLNLADPGNCHPLALFLTPLPTPTPPITSLRCAPRLVDVIMLHLSRGQTFSSLRHLEHIHLPEVTEKPPLSLPPPHPRAQAPPQAPPSVQAPPPRPAGRRGSGLQGGAADSRREKKGPEDEACRVVASCPASFTTVRGRSRRGPLRCGPWSSV